MDEGSRFQDWRIRKGMRKILGLTVLLLVISGLASGADHTGKNKPLPLEPDQQIWFFGMIPRDAVVSHHYALTNNHKRPVTIEEIISDCDCTRVPKTPIIVAPGETYLLKVEFDTKTYVGETNRDIKVVTDYKPNPEMTIFFVSLASRLPSTVNISPRMTAFIPGKNEDEFTIENLADEKTSFTIFIDNDSLFEVSETEFTLKKGQKQTVSVSPDWERILHGSYFSCLVLEVGRKEKFSVSIPIKINKY
jgi:hypothetical protein